MSFQLPDYTSPPLPEAIEATPVDYLADKVIDAARQAAANKLCGKDEQYCQIAFPSASTTTGVILYGGALIDPRAYSPLARTLQQRYGFTTVVPIFYKDLPWDSVSCSTGRVELAQQQFPHVKQWILAGHSFGAIAASLDLWSVYTTSSPTGGGFRDSSVAGMVFMAADARGDLGCGALNFSTSEIPFASLIATNDIRLNRTRWEENRELLPADTFFLDIMGGNHGQYGSYNDSLREEILKVGDGIAAIPREVQQDLTAAAIANVAARAGWKPAIQSTPLPRYSYHFASSSIDNVVSWTWTTLVLVVGFFWRRNTISVQAIGNICSRRNEYNTI